LISETLLFKFSILYGRGRNMRGRSKTRRKVFIQD